MGAPWQPPPVAAELTLPASVETCQKYPCIIFIGGSGPIDKDSTIGALKPFKDIALGLANRGIASCRFDKFAFTIAGRFLTRNTTTTLTDEYVYHARHTIRKVSQHPNIDHDRIFLLGHSLGGLIAARLAVAEPGPSVAGCVLMACPAQPIYRCAIRQLRYFKSLDESDGLPSGDEPSNINMIETLKKQAELADGPTMTPSTPASQLPRSECPVLVLQGARDYQVTVNEDCAAFYAKF
ncbi:alpha/beta hydrolase [Aspergillus thermomutatus]|uniref:Serine aminopeptidase S33 domain-containing protein n=1 Tax=Aspergillus thermomutatus TaxID=41047 RepID=A0A397GE50_ASPTH|nr:uncharacterized protein CDV56_102928 [Aspergillus thermomutatus]RHZ48399.1 hypothetical protein CDV56_102928 [Aspergillus thermomutatus]